VACNRADKACLRTRLAEAYSKQGSEFVVSLPRPQPTVEAVNASKHIASASREIGTKRRVLVVDDNIDAATAASDILSVLAHEVRMVHDGLAAVSTAAEMKPDIILLDIGLPGIDGYEAARRIRAHADIRRVLLIALTGWGQEHDKQQAYQAGFDRHFVKPVSLEQLKQILVIR
jgi:CheY-like chemotaxis protein